MQSRDSTVVGRVPQLTSLLWGFTAAAAKLAEGAAEAGDEGLALNRCSAGASLAGSVLAGVAPVRQHPERIGVK